MCDEPVPATDSATAASENSPPQNWVTVGTFWQAAEVHIARLKLESEGIECMVVDENVVAANWLWANAVGGIKLQVPEQFAAAARELLTTIAQKSMAAADGEPLFDGLQRCARCGSDDIHATRFSRPVAFLSILLLGAPLPFLRRRQRCAACGFEWTR